LKQEAAIAEASSLVALTSFAADDSCAPCLMHQLALSPTGTNRWHHDVQQQLQLLQLLLLLLRFATSQLLEIFQTALLLRASEYILLQLLS
jgi:hypothetical protein